jgi:hypothetical protein
VSAPIQARLLKGVSLRKINAYLTAFREGLQKLGWTEGRNIQIAARWGALDDAESRQQSAKELIALQPDLILTQNTPSTASMLHWRDSAQVKTSFVLLEAEVNISGSANHRALQTGFDTAATDEHGADLACLLERSPGLASE